MTLCYIAEDPYRYIGSVVGNGQCVAYVRAAADVPHTSQWRRGDKVRGAAFVSWLAIATFDSDGRYGNFTDGRSHTAILLAELDEGLLVLDQWSGQPVHERVIRFKRGAGDPCNDGDAYHVIVPASVVAA